MGRIFQDLHWMIWSLAASNWRLVEYRQMMKLWSFWIPPPQDSIHLLLTLQHFFKWMASAEKYLSCILICWILIGQQIFWPQHDLTCLNNLDSAKQVFRKYDSDAVQISLLLIGFRKQNLLLITFLCHFYLLPESHYHKY